MGFNYEYPLLPPMHLIWNDEFNGPSIDLSKWWILHEPRRGHWWDRADAYVQNGSLVLRTRRGADGIYHSGALCTESKFDYTHGYYEARMLVGQYGGHWPAFWLWCKKTHVVGDAGVDGTEIDIMEAPYRRTINHALHWDGYEADHKWANHTVDVAGLRGSWHTFGLWWTPVWYIFYIDGVETWRTNAGGVSQTPSFIFLTDEVDDWGGEADFANDYTFVDYVRVYSE